MGVRCGSQITLCNLPIRFDTYEGCSHACKYCFVKKKADISKIKKDDCRKALLNFISGSRTAETKWCDWKIPLHWGGMSDPFQPIEKKERISYECLKILAESQYPFAVSTKGRLIADEEYLALLSKCNCVVQISMVCSKYDILEQGAPTFEERLRMLEKVASKVKRVNTRIQPYMPEVLPDVMETLPRIANAGAHGVTIEGMKFMKAAKGTIKLGGDSVYPIRVLERDFLRIKQKAHEAGLTFYCAENRLRGMGDEMCCCGIEGLNGFEDNKYNICMMMNGVMVPPKDAMRERGTAGPFKTIYQTTAESKMLRSVSMCEMMCYEVQKKNKYYKEIFGKDV